MARTFSTNNGDIPTQLDSLQLDPGNYLKYSGVQLDSRKPTSYGMYTFQGWLNVDNKPTVSGLFVQSIQPNPGFYPEVAKFWRWTGNRLGICSLYKSTISRSFNLRWDFTKCSLRTTSR